MAKKTSKKAPGKRAAPAAAKASRKASKAPSKKAPSTPRAAPAPSPAQPDTPRLLAGGNPQIAKGYGDAPVRAYIAAIPGWKQGAARAVDAVITTTIPNVRKAVKWNSALYGSPGPESRTDWFASFHCFDRYLKVAFFRGTLLNPMPPVESKQKEVRYFHLHEGETLDEKQFATWVKQANKLPGEKM